MDKTTGIIFGFTLNIAFLLSSTASAALVEYSGFGTRSWDGGEHNVGISLTIDDNFRSRTRTLQEQFDNPDTLHLGRYGMFAIVETEVSVDGVTLDGSGPSSQGRGIDIYLTASHTEDPNGERIIDLSTLSPFIDGISSGWGWGHGQFLDESGDPYDWASWWGDDPTNDLPPILNITGLSDHEFGGYSSTQSIMLHPNPVPIPAAAWLFGSGLLGLFGIVKRKRSFKNPPIVYST